MRKSTNSKEYSPILMGSNIANLQERIRLNRQKRENQDMNSISIFSTLQAHLWFWNDNHNCDKLKKNHFKLNRHALCCSLWLGFSPVHLQHCCAVVRLRAIAQVRTIERGNSSFSCIYFDNHSFSLNFRRHFFSSGVITGRYEGIEFIRSYFVIFSNNIKIYSFHYHNTWM